MRRGVHLKFCAKWTTQGMPSITPQPLSRYFFFAFWLSHRSNTHSKGDHITRKSSQQSQCRMCTQTYIACQNRSCDGIAQTLAFFPCDDRPQCETRFLRIPASRHTTETHCPTCKTMTKQERKKLMRKAQRVEAQAEKQKEWDEWERRNAAMRRERNQAGPSTKVESRGVVDSGVRGESRTAFPLPQGAQPYSYQTGRLHANSNASQQYEHRTQHVSGSNEGLDATC